MAHGEVGAVRATRHDTAFGVLAPAGGKAGARFVLDGEGRPVGERRLYRTGNRERGGRETGNPGGTGGIKPRRDVAARRRDGDAVPCHALFERVEPVSVV